MSVRVNREVVLPDSVFGAGSGEVGEQARIALNFGPALSLCIGMLHFFKAASFLGLEDI